MSKVTDTSKDYGIGMILPGAIEAQEARGQLELVKSTQLPSEGMGSIRAGLETLGFEFVLFEPSTVGEDPLFCEVRLPVGWSKRATDHSMWSELVDGKGRVRARIFYKAAFYDRRAFIRFEARFRVDVPDELPAESMQFQILDNANSEDSKIPIYRTALLPYSSESYVEQQLECDGWLHNQGFPDYKNPLAYWD